MRGETNSTNEKKGIFDKGPGGGGVSSRVPDTLKDNEKGYFHPEFCLKKVRLTRLSCLTEL